MRQPFRTSTPTLLLGLAALAGCADELPSGSTLDRERVLGARIEVDGDPTRAWPAPGERVTLRWIIAGPGEPGSSTWAFAVCPADATGCAGDPFLITSGAGATPTLAIDVPSAAELGDAVRLRVVGAIDDTELTLTVPLAVAGVDAANHNPTLAVDALTLAGAPWTAPEPGREPPVAGAACAAEAGGASLPAVHAAAGEEVEVGVAVRAADREEYTDVAPDGTPRVRREILQISHYTTVGEFERQFSAIDEHDESEAPVARVAWLPAKADDAVTPSEGVIARFTFVLRDGRGGLDASSRFACLLP